MKEVIKNLKLQLVETQDRIIYTSRKLKERGIYNEYFEIEKRKSRGYEVQLIMAIKILQGN